MDNKNMEKASNNPGIILKKKMCLFTLFNNEILICELALANITMREINDTIPYEFVRKLGTVSKKLFPFKIPINR